jgi:hypothetical protein
MAVFFFCKSQTEFSSGVSQLMATMTWLEGGQGKFSRDKKSVEETRYAEEDGIALTTDRKEENQMTMRLERQWAGDLVVPPWPDPSSSSHGPVHAGCRESFLLGK